VRETLTFTYEPFAPYTQETTSAIFVQKKTRLVVLCFPPIQILDILLMYCPENQADICNNEALIMQVKVILSKYFSLLF